MEKDEYLKHLVKGYLPKGADLIVIEKPYQHTLLGSGSIDDDEHSEVVAAYRLENNCYVLILKYEKKIWKPIDTINVGHLDVTFLKVAPVTSIHNCSIILGLKVDDERSKLQIMDYMEDESFRPLLSQNITYNEIDVYDMDGAKSKDGKVEIALWKKDHKEAYDIKIYRWSKGKLTNAIDVYPHYFVTVERYYKDKVEQEPLEPLYWFYLAVAQIKVDKKEDAIKTINTALELETPYPSRKYLKTLKEITAPRTLIREGTLYPASIRTTSGTKWGYINKDGKFIIKPTYKKAEAFSEKNHLAIVKENEYLGLIDRFGNYVIKPKCLEINAFSEGLAIVVDDEGFKVADENGLIITDRAYDFIGNYHNHRAVFSDIQDSETVYGYLDEQGNEVIKATYLEANDFHEDKAIVKSRQGQYKLITPQNHVLHTYDLPYVGPYVSDGLLIFKNKSSKYGYMTEEGTVVLPAIYAYSNPFHNDLAIVNMSTDENKYGLINKKGEFIIKPHYPNLLFLEEERYAVGKALDGDNPFRGEQFAIADRNGRFLSNFEYNHVSDYTNWIASAYNQNDTFFINMNGGVMRALPIVEGRGTLTFNQCIKADVDYRTKYLTKDGQVIYEQNKKVPLNKRKRYVIEKKYRPNMDYLVYYPQLEGLTNEITEHVVNDKLKTISQAEKEIPNDQLLDYTLYVDFNIIFNKNQLVSIEIETYKFVYGSAHGITDRYYAHIDLKTGQFYKLGDLFVDGSNYKHILSRFIREQAMAPNQYEYVFPDADFTITDDQLFDITDNELTIYYKPYQIAPYVAGFPAFTIPFSELDSVIDKSGAFYKSFH